MSDALRLVRWLGCSAVPSVVLLTLLRRVHRRPDPWMAVGGTYALGVLAGVVVYGVDLRVRHFLGLDAAAAGPWGGQWGARWLNAGEGMQWASLPYLFVVLGPLGELGKLAATWPAFRSRYFDDPFDGMVYAGASGLGFAAAAGAFLLRAHEGSVWIARSLLATPAHLLLAMLWGYALGRVKRDRAPGVRVLLAWTGAAVVHALYMHMTFGRGATALVAVAPLLLAMGLVALWASRDLIERGERPQSGPRSNRLSVESVLRIQKPPSMRQVRAELLRRDRPLAIIWVIVGALANVGAMVGAVVTVAVAARRMGLDFSAVDENDVGAVIPVAVLGGAVLAAYPFAGFLVAKASRLPGLLEPALAALLAIALSVLALGVAAPVALVFAIALAPLAFGLACLGAWLGRPTRRNSPLAP